MKNGPLISDFHIKTSIDKEFSIAMFDYQRAMTYMMPYETGTYYNKPIMCWGLEEDFLLCNKKCLDWIYVDFGYGTHISPGLARAAPFKDVGEGVLLLIIKAMTESVLTDDKEALAEDVLSGTSFCQKASKLVHGMIAHSADLLVLVHRGRFGASPAPDTLTLRPYLKRCALTE